MIPLRSNDGLLLASRKSNMGAVPLQTRHNCHCRCHSFPTCDVPAWRVQVLNSNSLSTEHRTKIIPPQTKNPHHSRKHLLPCTACPPPWQHCQRVAGQDKKSDKEKSPITLASLFQTQRYFSRRSEFPVLHRFCSVLKENTECLVFVSKVSI